MIISIKNAKKAFDKIQNKRLDYKSMEASAIGKEHLQNTHS